MRTFRSGDPHVIFGIILLLIARHEPAARRPLGWASSRCLSAARGAAPAGRRSAAPAGRAEDSDSMTAAAGHGLPCSAQRGGEAVARRREFSWFARYGLVARGVSYAIIGILALQLAIGAGGKTTTQRGALLEIAERPFGRALLSP
ncbi:MAG TPA: DUF1206 domain-containing protein [Solirubrobacteraceae bacterium]|nr:DUF1206 domain-containing protein [Solirubrobacteraceae bacterium]